MVVTWLECALWHWVPRGLTVMRKLQQLKLCIRTMPIFQQHSYQLLDTTPPTVPWPTLDELQSTSSKGYISCAFPTFFPAGRADLVASRIYAVTLGNYFKHWWCIGMADSGTLYWTLRCIGMQFRLARSTFASTLTTLKCQCRSFMRWSAEKERCFQPCSSTLCLHIAWHKTVLGEEAT